MDNDIENNDNKDYSEGAVQRFADFVQMAVDKQRARDKKEEQFRNALGTRLKVKPKEDENPNPTKPRIRKRKGK